MHLHNIQQLSDKIAYKYHKSKVLTMDRILNYESEYRVKYPGTTHYYSSMSRVCNDYKEWNHNRIRELYNGIKQNNKQY